MIHYKLDHYHKLRVDWKQAAYFWPQKYVQETNAGGRNGY